MGMMRLVRQPARVTMDVRLAPIAHGFPRRARLSRVWTAVAYSQPRNRLMVLFALVPALLLLLAIALSPGSVGVNVTRPDNVDATFARFISAVATASTVAVSVAALTLGRELKGVTGQDHRHEANLEFRDRVRKASGLDSVPMALGPFLSVALSNVSERARAARRVAGAEGLRVEAEGIRLDAYLDFLEKQAMLVSDQVDRERRHPHRLLTAAMSFDHEVCHHLARHFARHPRLSEDTREAMGAVALSLKDVVVATRYVKTLDIQWGLSRMSSAVLLTTLPAILASVGMVLLYAENVPQAIGIVPAGGLVALALGLALLPIAAIVAYLLRFVFVNQHTLPAEDFVLGPEAPDVVEGRVPSGDPRRNPTR